VDSPTDEESTEEMPVKVKGKGKGPAVVRKGSGWTAVQRERNWLARRLNLHSRLYQIKASVKTLKVEHNEVMEELSGIIADLEELDV